MQFVVKRTANSYLKSGAFAAPGVSPQSFINSIGFEYVRGKWRCVSIEKAVKFIARNTYLVRHRETLYIFNNSTGCFEPVNSFNLPSVIRTVVNQKSIAGIEPWTKSLNEELTYAIKSYTVNEVIEFNKTPHIVLKNRAYDLEKFIDEDFNPRHFSTRKINCDYQPEADCSLFKQFVSEITCGQKDLEFQLQQIVGYIFANHNKAEKAFLIIGPARNGKSTFAAVIRELLGAENVSATPLKKLGAEFGLEDIVGKMVNITTESSKGENVSSAQWKALTSGDMVQVNGKGKAAYSTRITTKLISCLNYMPNFEELDAAVRRRLMIIPFVAQISEDKVDPDLLKKLIQEKSGILNWALDGLRSLANNNWHFAEAKSSQQMLDSFIASSDSLSKFISECVTAGSATEKIQISVIRELYDAWAHKNKVAKANRNGFAEKFCQKLELANIPFTRIKPGGCLTLKGITVNVDLNKNKVTDIST